MCTFLVPYMCIIIAVVLIHCLNVNYKYNKIIDVVILSTQHLKKKTQVQLYVIMILRKQNKIFSNKKKYADICRYV